MPQAGLPPSGPTGHSAVEHVHCEFAVFDHPRTVERVTEALRTAGAIGLVEPKHSEGERIGGASAAIATQGGNALRMTESGFEIGLPLPELAEWLRRRLASGVIIHDDAHTTHAVTVPQSVGERMEAALNEPFGYPSVTVVPGARGADDIENLAFLMGGLTTLVPLGERTALVAAPKRPSMLRKEFRPAIRLFHRDGTTELMFWSRHAVRRLQNPLRRLGANAQADLHLVWPAPPIFLVDDGGAPEALALQAGLWSLPENRMNDRLHGALDRMVTELALPRERLDAMVALVDEPAAPELVERIVTCLDLPPEVTALVHDPEKAETSGIAHAEPSGAMEQTLERQHLKRMRR